MIKRLAGCIRQYKRDTVLTPLFMLGEVSCECVIPLLTAELINNIQAGCSMNVILQFGLKLFLVAMLSLPAALPPAGSAHRQQRALPRICAGIYTIRCRIFRSRISTASPRRLL